ncbi:hypothetical protein INN71_15595 [Nocardioides sp. ChNu-153]|nr:hypothetical protein [Nocardioides sp. ChNu-153]
MRRRRTEQLAALRAVADQQAGVVSRDQLRELGFHREEVRRRVAAGTWVVRTPTVVSTTSGPPVEEQRLWIAVLHPSGPSALAGRTALALHGLSGWSTREVSVVVRTGQHLPADGIEVHRTRRPFERWTTHRRGLPVLRAEPAALLAASRLRHPRSAAGLIAACVQQRVTTGEQLLDWLPRLAPLPRARLLAEALVEVVGGAGSVAEMDLGVVCAAAGLVAPHRQRVRLDAGGRRRYTDAEWDLADGTVVVLEVDGAFHLEVAHWVADKRRHRRLSGPGRVVIGCAAVELRTEPGEVVADLVALGVPRRGGAAAA